MCGNSQEPLDVGGALAMLDHCLGVLATADAGSLTTPEQAELLRGLERAEARHTAARARVLAAFTAQGGNEDDGLGSARAWLRWHTSVTAGAATGAVGWARRLAAHPVVAEALAAGRLSASWARELCSWCDQLPVACRADAEEILVAAATGGAALADLAGLAREMYERAHRDDPTPVDDGFEDRYLRLGITFRGAGRAEGDLTPACAAALASVLAALGKKAGPEDARTAAQRRHDALEEACLRLIASGMLPASAGQPTHVNLHMTLSQLRQEAGASAVEGAWATERATGPGWLSGPDADAAACDATFIPVVTGHVDTAVLDQIIDAVLGTLTGHAPADDSEGAGEADAYGQATGPAGVGGDVAEAGASPGRLPLSPRARRRLRAAILSLAIDALSGPTGLAALLRTGLDGLPGSASLPLDIGAPTDTIPAHLRRVVTRRHRHCAFPGCYQPASDCQIHHIIPRSRGGPTALHNLLPLCRFHHLIVIHRWGWSITLHPDGTTTASSPDGRTLHSHSPPTLAA